MSTTAYVNRLRESRTFKTGIIEDIEEYQFNVRFGGLLRSLPPLPYANDDRHVVVLEVRGNHPSVISVLSEPNVSINPSVRDADKLVFIFINVKLQRITVPAPQDGYLLGDGQRIFANIEISFKVSNVKEFWQSDKDPIANLESQVINETKKYFSKLNSTSLINALDISQRKLEQLIIDSQLSVIMEGLQALIQEKAPTGIKIDRVHANIALTAQMQDFFDRRRNELLNPGGIMDRHDVERRIDSDSTFAPYKLRDLIMALDPGLLEDFHSMQYGDAMRQVHRAVTKARTAYLERKNNEEIDRISKAIDIAKKNGLPDMHILTLQDKLGEKLLSLVDSSPVNESQSNQDYVRTLLSDKNQEQLGDSASQRPALSPAKESE